MSTDGFFNRTKINIKKHEIWFIIKIDNDCYDDLFRMARNAAICGALFGSLGLCAGIVLTGKNKDISFAIHLRNNKHLIVKTSKDFYENIYNFWTSGFTFT